MLLLVLSALDWSRGQDDEEGAMPDDEDEDMDMDGMGGMDDGEDMGDTGGGGGGSAIGVLNLDNYTFDKVVGLKGQRVVVKFDKTYPDGDEEDQFKSLAELVQTVPGLILGEVQIDEDDEEGQNANLAKTFALKKDDFPAYYLFRGLEDKQKYSGKITADDLASWLRRQGLKVPRAGTILALDEIATRFLKGDHPDSEIEAAKRLMESDYKEDSKAPWYAKIMAKIKEKGIEYVSRETARVEKVMQGQIAEHKRTELADKMRILTVFATPHDEL